MSDTILLRAAMTGADAGPRRTTDHDLTLVIPAFNEAARLPGTLREVREWLDRWGIDYRVIVADDGSSDGTVDIGRCLGPRFSTVGLPHNQGKGAAVRAGILAATGRIAAFTDADLPYALESLQAGYDLIQARACQVVFGARDLAESRVLAPRRLGRRIASAVFQQVGRALISRDVVDTQAGLKLFEASAARAIFSRATIDGFAFDAEVVFLTHRLGFVHRRIPVTLVNEESSSVSVWRHSLPMLLEIGRVRWRAFRGAYDQALESTAAEHSEHGHDEPRRAAA